MSQPTVMQDVQAMELFGKSAYTKNTMQSGVMDYSSDAQNSLQRIELNTVDKSVARFGQCEMQTILINNSTNVMQTDFVDVEESATQTEKINANCTSTQTNVSNFEEKESQTNAADVKSQEVQTEIKVVEEQIIQTEAVPQRDSQAQTESETVPQRDAEAQTETETVSQIESESQTDLMTKNITTVDKIEIVQGMESFPTQTDAEELMEMCPFKSDNKNGDGNLSVGDKSPDKDSTSEVESNISSVSKTEEKVPVTVSVGLDMHVGEYKELTFPPVASGAKKPTQLQPPVQERSPSPIDLCTKWSNDNNKVHATPKRKSSTITVSHNPYDYCRPGKSRRIEDTRISPAHQSPVNLSASCSRHLAPVRFMSQSSAILQHSAVANLHQSSVRDLSFKPSKSFESRPIVHTPHLFRFKLGSNLDTFASLSLKDRLLAKKISGISQKRILDARIGIT